MEQRFSAPIDKVFAAVTDHAGMSDWTGAKVTVDKPGTPAPNGLGAVRKISMGLVNIFEEVVRWEEPTAMDYRVLRGAPLKDHLGELRLRADGAGTVLDYKIRFRFPWYLGGGAVGSLIAKQLKGEIEKGLAKLSTRLS